MRYEIKRGDTLGGIAKRFGTTVQKLASKNRIMNVDRINTGNSIIVPDMEKPTIQAQVETAKQKSRPAWSWTAPDGKKYSPESDGNMYFDDQATLEIYHKEMIKEDKEEELKRINLRQKAMLEKGSAPVESKSLMARSQRKASESKSLLGKDKEETPESSFNIDPLKVLGQQALLSVVERAEKAGIPLAEWGSKFLSQDITEKDLNKDVVKAMRKNTIKFIESGEDVMGDKSQGVSRRGDITEPFEGKGNIKKFTQFFTDPSKSQAFITGATDRGGIILDENNNLILTKKHEWPTPNWCCITNVKEIKQHKIFKGTIIDNFHHGVEHTVARS